MKNNYISMLFIITVLITSITACSVSVSTANITDAYTAREMNGKKTPTTTFDQDEVFYLIIDIENAQDDTITKVSWIAADAEGIDPNFLIHEGEFAGGGKKLFELSNTTLWPIGTYKANVYLDDKLDRTMEFTVEGTASTSSSSSGVSIVDVYLVRYIGEDYEKTSVYSPDEDFICDVELNDYETDAVVKVVWIAVKAEGIAANSRINENEGPSDGNALEFALNNPNPWPTGEYAAEISLDGEYQETVVFSVE